jgi:hypothetical protein
MPTRCTGTQANLASVLNVHLQQSLSIAYYNGVDNSRLGGVNFSVPGETTFDYVFLGKRRLIGPLLECRFAVGNINVLQGSPSCKVRVVPIVVSDGCYNITSSSSTSTSTNKSSESAKKDYAITCSNIYFL